MASTSDRLYDSAFQAVQRLFSDTTVTAAETRTSLEALKQEIDNLLETLPDDESDGE